MNFLYHLVLIHLTGYLKDPEPSNYEPPWVSVSHQTTCSVEDINSAVFSGKTIHLVLDHENNSMTNLIGQGCINFLYLLVLIHSNGFLKDQDTPNCEPPWISSIDPSLQALSNWRGQLASHMGRKWSSTAQVKMDFPSIVVLG
nr:hypothetical protein Iba_chr12cCG5290 [Ipomoea batatas]